MNELYDVLKTSKASDFLIREEQTESREAFFIGQKLDMSRAKKVTHTFLTVFVDSEDGKFRGSAEKEIHQGISREEMQQEIDQALFAAQFVQNPWYPIAEPSDAPANDGMPDASRDLTSELVKLVQAMQEIKSEEETPMRFLSIRSRHASAIPAVSMSHSPALTVRSRLSQTPARMIMRLRSTRISASPTNLPRRSSPKCAECSTPAASV